MIQFIALFGLLGGGIAEAPPALVEDLESAYFELEEAYEDAMGAWRGEINAWRKARAEDPKLRILPRILTAEEDRSLVMTIERDRGGPIRP